MAVKSIDDMSKKELQEHYRKEREWMFKRIQEMEDTIQDLNKTIEDNEININDLKLELSVTKEKLKQAIAAKYQSQNNQVVIDIPILFSDAEEEVLKVEEAENQAVITIGEYQKKKR